MSNKKPHKKSGVEIYSDQLQMPFCSCNYFIHLPILKLLALSVSTNPNTLSNHNPQTSVRVTRTLSVFLHLRKLTEGKSQFWSNLAIYVIVIRQEIQVALDFPFLYSTLCFLNLFSLHLQACRRWDQSFHGTTVVPEMPENLCLKVLEEFSNVY